MGTETGSDSNAQEPKRDEEKIVRLDGIPMPSNDEGLCAVEILGRCSKCHIAGWIDYPNKVIPGTDIDKLLANKPVKCFCDGCKANSEFVPMRHRIKHLPANVQNLQDSFKKGLVR